MNHQQKQKAHEQRRKKMVALRLRGFSLREIGDMMTPRISGQRVAQVLRKEGAK
jgi:hypothetical protein